MTPFIRMLSSATRLTLIMLVITVCYLSIRQLQVPQELNTMITTVIAFFFGTKAGDMVTGGNRPVPQG